MDKFDIMIKRFKNETGRNAIQSGEALEQFTEWICAEFLKIETAKDELLRALESADVLLTHYGYPSEMIKMTIKKNLT